MKLLIMAEGKGGTDISYGRVGARESWGGGSGEVPYTFK